MNQYLIISINDTKIILQQSNVTRAHYENLHVLNEICKQCCRLLKIDWIKMQQSRLTLFTHSGKQRTISTNSRNLWNPKMIWNWKILKKSFQKNVLNQLTATLEMLVNGNKNHLPPASPPSHGSVFPEFLHPYMINDTLLFNCHYGIHLVWLIK